MSKSNAPTLQDIKELVAFLPRLYAEGFTPVKRWHGGTTDKDAVLTLPWPEYDEVVDEFFRSASRECWMDHEYQPEEASRMLMDEKLVETASLAQIRTMLTYYVRGERFCDGHWAALIDDGRLRRLLERLGEIAGEME